MALLILTTEQEGLVIRQLSTEADDLAYFEAQNEDPEHITRFDNTLYKTLEDVKKARENTKEKLILGIWSGKTLVGKVSFRPSEDGAEAEIGYWLRPSAVGKGYATLATKALTLFLISKYKRVFAEVHVDNQNSANVLRRAGYLQKPGIVNRKWGPCL